MTNQRAVLILHFFWDHPQSTSFKNTLFGISIFPALLTQYCPAAFNSFQTHWNFNIVEAVVRLRRGCCPRAWLKKENSNPSLTLTLPHLTYCTLLHWSHGRGNQRGSKLLFPEGWAWCGSPGLPATHQRRWTGPVEPQSDTRARGQ